MKTEEQIMQEAHEAYLDCVKGYLRPILIEFNKYIESGCLEEFECSEDWMIEENVNHFLDNTQELQEYRAIHPSENITNKEYKQVVKNLYTKDNSKKFRKK